ncbi:MAG: decarboxylase [Lachnospiraceae bacterium]|nr:decarboxylase [Lachnospiraceae bacterium]
METYLLDQLTEYAVSDAYPLHMPGHKRQMHLFEDAFSIDITEIEGFDNLHHAEGILLEAEQRAARLYGADETYFLVNGSTCGVLAAISASVRRGGRILMARNSHKAAFHAALLNDLQVSWLYPEMDLERGMYGSISPQQVRDALRNDADGPDRTCASKLSANDLNRKCTSAAMPAAGRAAEKPSDKTEEITEKLIAEKGRIEAVFITSPTYDGVVSDIRSIAREVHALGAILIVDEAHGAHFAMHPYFPESALSCGADLVVNSLHKTMPSLTQTALLHVKGERADRERLRKYLDIYQSSSPSYVLMAGMDECVRLMEARGGELFDAFVGRLERLRAHLGKLRMLRLVTGEEPELAAFAYDRSKVLVSTAQVQTENGRMTGSALAQILRECYHLEVEMAAETYITAIMTVADTQEGFDRLEVALLEIDGQLSRAAASAGKLETDEAAASVGGLEMDETVFFEEEHQPDGVASFMKEHQPDETAPSGENHRSDVSEHVSVLHFPEAAMTMTKADDMPHEPVLLEDSPGRVAAEFVYLYPPGIPLLVPGECVPEQFPELLDEYRREGLQVQGMADYSARTLRCIIEDV